MSRSKESLPIAMMAWVLFSASALRAQDDDLVVRVATEPEKSVLVGQRITIRVDVLARDVWANLPGQLRIDIPGAVVFTPPSQSVRLSEQIRGGSFIGGRYELWIYPQRQGKLQIPGFDLDVQLKPLGLGKETESKSATIEPITLEIRYPEGVPVGQGVICARDFSAQQDWKPESSDLRVGDGITRTIERSVAGTPGMVLTPFQAGQPEGVRVYPKQPEVDDSFHRGSLTGKRTDSVTYVFEAPGQVQLPSIRVSWWDLDTNKLQTTELAGRKLDIAPAEETVADTPASETDPVGDRRGLVISGMLFAIVALLIFSRQPLKMLVRKWHAQIESSEAAYFRRFVAAARTGQPKKTMRALVQWWDTADASHPAPRLDVFLDQYGDEQTRGQLASLQLAVDSGNASWQGDGFAGRMRSARQRWKANSRAQTMATTNCLPPLNPRSPK